MLCSNDMQHIVYLEDVLIMVINIIRPVCCFVLTSEYTIALNWVFPCNINSSIPSLRDLQNAQFVLRSSHLQSVFPNIICR